MNKFSTMDKKFGFIPAGASSCNFVDIQVPALRLEKMLNP